MALAGLLMLLSVVIAGAGWYAISEVAAALAESIRVAKQNQFVTVGIREFAGADRIVVGYVQTATDDDEQRYATRKADADAAFGQALEQVRDPGRRQAMLDARQGIRDYFIRAAEKMPEADYGFRPAPDIRSFGQQIAHVADDQYNLCAPAKGETRKAAYTEIENTLSKKDDLIVALKQAFVYCDGAYDALTDASGAELVNFSKGRITRFAMLNWNLWHTWEHYGNITGNISCNKPDGSKLEYNSGDGSWAPPLRPGRRDK